MSTLSIETPDPRVTAAELMARAFNAGYRANWGEAELRAQAACGSVTIGDRPVTLERWRGGFDDIIIVRPTTVTFTCRRRDVRMHARNITLVSPENVWPRPHTRTPSARITLPLADRDNVLGVFDCRVDTTIESADVRVSCEVLDARSHGRECESIIEASWDQPEFAKWRFTDELTTYDLNEDIFKGRMIIARSGSAAVGVGTVVTSPAAFDLAVLSWVAVRPDWRNMGVGRHIVEAALSYANAERLALMWVSSEPRFFERIGFAPVHRLSQGRYLFSVAAIGGGHAQTSFGAMRTGSDVAPGGASDGRARSVTVALVGAGHHSNEETPQ